MTMLTVLAGGGFRGGVEGLYIIDFIVYVGLLWYFLRKPVAAFVTARREQIMADMDEAKRMREEAEAQLKDYQSRLDNLEAEIAQLLEDARKAGEDERQKLLVEANKAAQRVRDDAKARLEQEGRRLQSELQTKAIDLAMGVAENMIATQITDAHRRRFVGEYITDLEGRAGEL